MNIIYTEINTLLQRAWVLILKIKVFLDGTEKF